MHGTLVWSAGTPGLVAHRAATGAAAPLAPLAGPRVGRVAQVEHVGDVVVVRDDLAFQGHDARTGAWIWRKPNPAGHIIADVIAGRLVLVGHEGDDLAVSFLSPGDGATQPIASLHDSMQFLEPRFARRGGVLHFVTDRRALVAIDLVSRAVVLRTSLLADRVMPIAAAAGRPFVAWTRDGARGVVTNIASVNEGGALRHELAIDGDCTAFAASEHVVAAQVKVAPVYGGRRVHAWLADDPSTAIVIEGGGRLFPAGDRLVVAEHGEAARVIEPRGTGLGVHPVRLPPGTLFAAGRALLPSAEGTLSSIDLYDLPRATAEGDEILPPPRAVGEDPRLEPLDAARCLEERGVPVAPLYDRLTRLYYRDGDFRWRLESLGLVLRDPRRRWLSSNPELVVFAEAWDGALFAFDGPSVVRCDPMTRAPSPFAPAFDEFLAQVLARADPPGTRAMVLAALRLDESFLR
jgi:hypothetical protein